MTDLVARPWANGTDWEIWEHNNCSKCIHEPTCELIEDIFLHGGMRAGIAERMGWQDEYQETGRWFCAERETEPAPPKPAATVMAEAGAKHLPGFAVAPLNPQPRPGLRRYSALPELVKDPGLSRRWLATKRDTAPADRAGGEGGR